MNTNIKTLTRISLLLSFAIVISIVESIFISSFIVPGVKLGLANFVSLLILYFYGLKVFAKFNFLRVLLVGVLRYGLGFGFLISLGGIILSTCIVILIYKYSKASIFSISICGALFHSLGQIIVVSIIYQNIYMFNYLYILMPASIIAGFFIAIIAKNVIEKTPIALFRY